MGKNGEDRRAIMRMMLGSWGNTINYCALERKKIEELLEQIEAMHGLKGSVITGMPHGSAVSSTVENAVISIEASAKHFAEAAEKMEANIADALRRKVAIDEHIEKLDELQKQVIELRYIERCGWEVISHRTSYDMDYLGRVERKVLDALADAMLPDYDGQLPFEEEEVGKSRIEVW